MTDVMVQRTSSVLVSSLVSLVSGLVSGAVVLSLAAVGCSRGSSAKPPEGEPRQVATAPTVAAVAAAANSAPEPATSIAVAPDASPIGSAAGPRAGDSPMERTPDIEYVPTPQNVVDKMLEVANVGKNDVLYDLGCGDGRIMVTAAKKFGIKARGFDIDPQRVKESKENIKKNGVEHLVTVEQKDIFKVDLSPATVVTLYLLPELNVKLIPQLEKLKPGSRIVSHDFDMEGVQYEKWWTVMAKDHRTPEDREHYIYLWKTPLRKVTAKK